MQQVETANREANILISQAHEARAAGREEESLQKFEQAYAVYRVVDEAAALDSLAHVYVTAESYDRAVEVLTEAIKLRPDVLLFYESRGIVFWYGGHFVEAVDDLTRSLGVSPDLLNALSCRGQALAEGGQFERALDDLNRCIDLADTEDRKTVKAYALSGRGLALGGLGFYSRSLADFSSSINLEPENAWVYFNRAVTYERMRRGEEAMADLRTSLRKRGPALNRWKREYALSQLQPSALQ
jgi:tetratricopeptide (TPR) repeat protein